MYKNTWAKIVEIHQYSKELWIIGEEMGMETFIQPLQEQRHALEHIVRSRIVEMDKGINDDYVQINLERALGHVYRSFFDVADWVNLGIKTEVTELMKGYSSECIAKEFPIYYQEIRPTLERMCIEIAKIRGEKDISKNAEIIPEVEKYRIKINELLKMLETIHTFIPQLEECKKEENRKKVWSKIWGVFLVGLAVLLGWLFSFFNCRQ